MRAVFITGGTTGIGMELAKLYLSQGWKVGVCGRDRQKFDENFTTDRDNLSFYGVDVDYEVKNSTVLMYEENDSISRHNHFPYTFVAATYICVSDNSSSIMLGSSWPNLEIKPRNNMCIIFPSHLSHEVLKTKSDRIMITMDLQVII